MPAAYRVGSAKGKNETVNGVLVRVLLMFGGDDTLMWPALFALSVTGAPVPLQNTIRASSDTAMMDTPTQRAIATFGLPAMNGVPAAPDTPSVEDRPRFPRIKPDVLKRGYPLTSLW